MTKRLTLALSFALLAPLVAPTAASAHPPNVDGSASLGLGFGDPTALDLKLWTSRDSGFDFGVGLERFDDVLGLYGEYEVGLAAFALGDSGGRGAFYIGLGGAVAFDDGDKTSAALVIPIGLDLRFRAPIDLFVEARPGIGLVDRPAFGLGGQLGVRLRL
ncbi:MAG: hypothetical protein IT385_22745 [Deltaproteobacteria bacterium]|nr:hypothetical protein [Deltaproteobacteria bacterium]